jgi:hypothetical protein
VTVCAAKQTAAFVFEIQDSRQFSAAPFKYNNQGRISNNVSTSAYIEILGAVLTRRHELTNSDLRQIGEFTRECFNVDGERHGY